MITIQPSITLTLNFTEEFNNNTNLKLKKKKKSKQTHPEAVAWMYSVKKKNVLKFFSQNSQKNTCFGFSFSIKLEPETCNFIEKEAPARVFFCKFCETFKISFL